MNKKLLVLGVILIVIEVALIFNMFYPALSANQNKLDKKPVPSHGAIKSIDVGIYVDQACTTPVQSIQWGIIEPGTTANQTFYVRNEATSTSSLKMITSNWNPRTASNYISLNWDYTGQTLQVNQIVQVKFTLLITENVQGITDFNFDVTITSS